MKILGLLLILVYFHQTINGARILAIFPFQQKSHFIFFESLAKGLAERGHVIDVVSHFPQKEPFPRYNDISLLGTMDILTDVVTVEDLTKLSVPAMVRYLMIQAGTDLCEKMLSTKTLQNLYHNSTTQYELLITEIFGTDCFLSFAHKFGIPMVGASSTFATPWTFERFGMIENPSFVPCTFLDLSGQLSLLDRVKNTILSTAFKLSYHYLQTLPSDEIARQILDTNLPSMRDMAQKMSLMLVNTHFSVYGSLPLPPNVIEVGGIHIKRQGKLPQDLERLLNESTQGVILFSLGSMVKGDSFSEEQQRAMLNTFAELPHTVIWKADKNLIKGPIPKNIHFGTWFSQREVLCHLNTKLFITHGGILGTQESIYCGVPMVGIPFFADQPFNVALYERKGIAVRLDPDRINDFTFNQSIRTVLYNAIYRENVRLVSQMFRDQPISPMDKAAYWIEYVIKYRGAEHLRPQYIHLAWYQIYLIDVWFVIISTLITVLYISYWVVKLVFRLTSRRKDKLKTS